MNTTKKENHMRIGEASVDDISMFGFKDYDLCPDCMKELQHWLNGKGELKEAK